jgi:hypothetical protein
MQTRCGVTRLSFEHVHDHPRALVLVLQVGRVDEHEFVRRHGQVEVLLEDRRLVGGVLVQADLADAEHVGASRNSGMSDDLARQRDVLGLLGVDAEPRSSADAVERRPLRLDLGEVAEVVAEALGVPRSNPAQNAGSETPRSRRRPSAGSRRWSGRSCGCAGRCSGA